MTSSHEGKAKRGPKQWTSKNRSLVRWNGRQPEPGRNRNFEDEETEILLSLWGNPVIQRDLVTAHRKDVVIARIADELTEYGYKRSVSEIKVRIKNLKCSYNRMKREIELGVSNASSWKHFKTMDTIMKRAIFSVLPNEIPKPSLKYQQEMERIEQENNKDVEIVSMDVGPRIFADPEDCGRTEGVQTPLSIHKHVPVDETKNDTEDSRRGIVKTPLIIPKDEPVDKEDANAEFHSIDSEGQKQNADSMTSRLVNKLTIPCGKLVNGNSMQPTTSSQPGKSGMTQSILIANQTNTMPPGGKISLVPANFLLQPNSGQPQQLQLRQQPQQRIICTQSNAQTSTGMVTSAGAGRMKVLLVNTFPNGKTTNAIAGKEGAFTNPNIISTASINKTTTPDAGVPRPPGEPTNPAEELNSNKNPGLDTLFSKLIHMQNENNDIQRQRLEVERQRLEFEKTMADKLLTALTSLAQVQRTDNGKNGSGEQYVKDKPYPSNFSDEHNGFQLLTPKIEKDD